jgi:cystathionine beta-lyase/cystathionine gamma-synthase
MPEQHPARMGHPAPSTTCPSAPPIYQTTAFDVPDLDALEEIYAGAVPGDIYTRDSNPNHSALANAVAALERAEAGAVFASGMGALGSIFLTLTEAGDHVLLAGSLYGKTLQLASRMQRQASLQVSTFDASQPATLTPLITPRTKFVLVETVSNPLTQVVDVAAIVAAAGSVPVVVDSTFTTPELVRPSELGAAIVMHSASKYLNGHGDLMLGVAAGSAALMKRLTETASIFGQNANPFESWLCQRGLRTLPLRMAQICKTTNALAAGLASHPAVRRVVHPSQSSHPSHELARQLYPNGTGGILAIELISGGRDAVNRLMRRLDHVPFSPTLADARTTLSHPATTSHRFMTPEQRAALGIRNELVRISVGLEPVDQLLPEFLSALDGVS